MLETIVQLCGGIGLFLLGMTLMTDSLKDMAGEKLRLWLSRFTGSPSKAMFSGIGFTLAVQSSTATTLATIGFVGAGVLTLAQAMGVIIGANIGTTSTGWMVALLGVKFSITSIALPLIALGAILKLLTSGRLALFGLCMAGFGLIFFGIDQLQVAMSGLAERVDFSIFTYDTFLAQLLLIGIGIVMTILLQSSSAAITVTLAALASGTIQMHQALLLVIGQNIGTVATAVLAVIGASVDAKRTAAVHVIFNIVSAILAFFILIPIISWLSEQVEYFSTLDDVLMVAGFHTAYSVLGACFFMPFLRPFGALLTRLIPDHPSKQKHIQLLDQASLSIPYVAVQTAENVLFLHIYDQLNYLKQALREGVIVPQNKLIEFDELMKALDAYLEKINLPDLDQDRQKLVGLLRIAIYAHVLRSDLSDIQQATLIRTQPTIFQIALDYVNILENYSHDIFIENDAKAILAFQKDLLALKLSTDENRQATRSDIVQYVELNRLSAAKNLQLLAAQRWLERLIAHTQRLANVLVEK